jgi:prepilin-type N-terminal cleavage/methylation domain-containing protein
MPHLPRASGVTLVELLVSMVILGVVTTLLIAGWVSLQSSYARSVKSNNAHAEARDALARASREIRDAQPSSLAVPGQSPFTMAGPMEIAFYSAFNSAGVRADGTATGALRLTRVYLDSGGSTAQKTLYWQRDTDNSGAFDGADRKIVLARDVVNASVADTSVTPSTSYTAIFTYGYRDGAGDFTTADTIASADLTKIISVQIHLLVDENLLRSPTPADLQTTVRPRNAPQE